MTIAAIIISIAAIATALWMAFTSRRLAPVCALCAYVILMVTSAKVPTISSVTFWAVAAAIATAINYLLPPSISSSRAGLSYILVASVCGSVIGLLIAASGIILGAVVGALLGAIAFSRTPQGAVISRPLPKYVNYICAKGLPAVITICICMLSANIIFLLCQSL
ncbi:MAG: hypothetical protein NC111_01560 [Bacteroides sp.]|nr:hypothetical protein [Bacteroides sp.]MCM1413581.1 hypothetical protein [Bacteroides sp.]MCM1471202.1 hypothetical protein [Bacteroides sp.]